MSSRFGTVANEKSHRAEPGCSVVNAEPGTPRQAQRTCPSAVRTQLSKLAPSPRSVVPYMFGTGTGVNALPDPQSPQQSTRPSSSNAALCPSPTASARAPATPGTGTACELGPDGVPAPSSPDPFRPQHATRPPARSAQTCESAPRDRSTAPLSMTTGHVDPAP